MLSRKKREKYLDENGGVKDMQNSPQNFPMQAQGKEMPRLTLTDASDDKLAVRAPSDDAIIVVAPAEREKEAIDSLRSCMRRASITVTPTNPSVAIEVPVGVNVIRYSSCHEPDKKPEAIENGN